MKFASKLSAHLTPEWRKQYVDYDGLKDFLLTYIDKKIRDTKDWDADFVAFLDQQDVEFFELCVASLQKVESFFAEKLAEAKRKFSALAEELESFLVPERSRLSAFKASISRKPYGSCHQSYAELTEPTQRQGVYEVTRPDSISEKNPCVSTGELHLRQRISSSTHTEKRPRKLNKKLSKKHRGVHDLKFAFSEFYLSLVLLQNYQVLNFTGFRKILKKHDKLFRRDNGVQWRKTFVDGAEFNTNREIDELIAKVEDIFTEKLEHGDRSKAMKRLRVPPLSEKHNPKAVFRFGFFAGVFLVQVAVIVLSSIFLRPLPEHYVPALRIFRSTFLIILFLCLLGVNTYGWRSSGVNHVLIFEINPRSHLDHFQLLELSLFLAVVWGCAVIYFIYSEVLHVPGYLSPFLLVIFLCFCLLNPFKFFQYRARRWLLRVLGRIFLAPFYEVKFADFWLADQLNSMSFLFPEMAFFVCFYTSQVSWTDGLRYSPTFNSAEVTYSTSPACAFNSNSIIANGCRCSGIVFGIAPILRVLPAWFRFAQCLRRYRDMKEKKLVPHVVNAGKYSTTFLSTACRAWFETAPGRTSLVFYIFASIINSTYSYTWDIRMDWGLCDCDSSNRFLREETVYQHHVFYYVAIVENLVLRFSWTFAIGLRLTIQSSEQFLASILPTAEVVRRFIWNFFRLENEHLNNCGEFRAVRDIFIRPERRDYNHNAFSFANSHNPHTHRRFPRDLPHSPSPNRSSGDLQFGFTAASRMWHWLSEKAFHRFHGNTMHNPTREFEMHESVTNISAPVEPLTYGNPRVSTHGSAYEQPQTEGHISWVCEGEPSISHRCPEKGIDRPLMVSTLSLPTSRLVCVSLERSISDSEGQIKEETTSSSKSNSTYWESESTSEQENTGFHPTATNVTLLTEAADCPHRSASPVSILRAGSVHFGETCHRPDYTATSFSSVYSGDGNGRNSKPIMYMDPRFGVKEELPEALHRLHSKSSANIFPREILIRTPSTGETYKADHIAVYGNSGTANR